MKRSRISWPKRIMIIVAGGVVLLAGSMARALEQEYGGTNIESEHIAGDEGTMAIYDLPDGGRSHEVQEIDASTSVVYAGIDTDTLVEVFRGTNDEAEQWVNAHTIRLLVFEGPVDEAIAWDEARQEAGKNMLIPNLIISAGLVILAAGLTFGWGRKPREPEPR